jgi:hypothetical protein
MSRTRDKDVRMEESSIALDPDSEVDRCQPWHAGLCVDRLSFPYLYAFQNKRMRFARCGRTRIADRVPQEIGDTTTFWGLFANWSF